MNDDRCPDKAILTCSAGNNPAAIAQIENGTLRYLSFTATPIVETSAMIADEDFIMDPLEELPDEKLDFSSNAPLPAHSDKKLYRRPYSRVGLGQKFDMSVSTNSSH